MGAADDAFITLDRVGAARCTGGLCAAARDPARVGRLLLDESAIVPASWIEDTAMHGDATAWRTGEWATAFGGMDMAYRNGWYIVRGETPMLFAMGIHGQNLFVDRARQLVVAKLSSQDELDYRSIGLTHRAVVAIGQFVEQR